MQVLKNIYIFLFIIHASFYFTQETGIINFNSKNNLPTNAVHCIFKDKNGFYWIGTQAGLCQYNGYEIEKIKIDPKDSFSIKCLNIYSLAEYRNFLIIGCENGITFYNQIENKFIKFPEIEKLLGGITVYNLFVLNQKLYIISEDGLFEYNFINQKIQKYVLKNQETSLNSDTKLFFNVNNFLLIDPNLLIQKIDTLNLTSQPLNIECSKKNYPKDLIQVGNNIYILLNDYGVIRVDATILKKIDEPLLINKIHGTTIKEPNAITHIKNKLYISFKNGIIEFDIPRSMIQFINIGDKNESERIRKVYNIDNNLFVTTYLNGFYIIPVALKKFTNPFSELINNKFANTFAVLEYEPGKILIGGEGKLLLYNIIKNSIEKDYSHLFKNMVILSIIPSKEKGKFYLGTWGNGLILFDLEKEKIKNLLYSDANRDILSILLDSDTLWCGTVGEGLYKYNLKTKKNLKFEIFNNYTINFITKIKNHYWVATSEDGLYKINSKNEIILHLNVENKLLSNNTVYHFIEDSNYVYVATDNGLTIYDKNLSKSYFFYDSDGLLNSTILSVHKDKNNNLWLSTTKGITKMILSRLNNPALRLFYNYSYIDGLTNYEYNQGAHCVLKNGYLVYGGVSGIDIFNPTKIRSSYDQVPVYITSFKKSGKEYPTDTNIILKKYFETDWRQNNIQMEFTAINPFSAHKTLYKYKLVGYDDEYSEPSPIRYASYTGLPGGTYILQVLATNHDGEWNIKPHIIYIKVTPPFWKTTWFIALSSILVFGSIFGFNQYRTYQVKKRNKELEQKINERTKELATKNHEILSSIEYAKRIQQAILPTNKYLQNTLPNAFILYKPKDIVSGDFYWVYEISSKDKEWDKSIIVAVVDCTGHGVPGALMSMIGNNLLNQIVIEKNIVQPQTILNEMNRGVQLALKQGQSDIQTNDGMDASIVLLKKNREILWAGAYRPLLIIRANSEIQKIEGDKYPIGGVQLDPNRTYTQHTIELEKGDIIYLFSDGYADQFGGDRGRKMMMKKFISLLHEIHLKPLNEQKQILDDFFNQWKGNYEQVDDVLIIGISC